VVFPFFGFTPHTLATMSDTLLPFLQDYINLINRQHISITMLKDEPIDAVNHGVIAAQTDELVSESLRLRNVLQGLHEKAKSNTKTFRAFAVADLQAKITDVKGLLGDIGDALQNGDPALAELGRCLHKRIKKLPEEYPTALKFKEKEGDESE
jgi:hypothetical protein